MVGRARRALPSNLNLMAALGRRHVVGGAAAIGMTALWPSRPSRAATAMGVDAARHLLSRTTFGGTPTEIAAFETMDYVAGVDRLLDGARAGAVTASPVWTGSPEEQAEALRNWWVEEMLATDQPLVERMTLFWHGHFTSAFDKVRDAPALQRQNALFRREALGNFARLLKAVAHDPAMLIYLDGRQANENFARELFELFTLGEGHYGEADIRNAAHAFAQGGGDGVLEGLLAHRRTAELVCGKLWREFVSLEADGAEIARLATILRDGGYEMKPVLRAMFLSPAFRDPGNRGTLIKSPVELVVGSVHLLGLPVPEKTQLVRMMGALGQLPFDPPDVKGWPGGESWITSYTLVLREQLMRRMIEATTVAPMVGAEMAMERRPVEGRSLRDAGNEAKLGPALAGFDSSALLRTLLPRQPVDPVDASGGSGAIVAAAMLDPVYQLK